MIETLLGLFGYVKVPADAVRLSMYQETFFEKLSVPDPEHQEIVNQHIQNQKTITALLRAGRSITVRN